MRKLLKILIVAPFAVLFLAFALANRQSVTVAFDPLNSGDIPAPQIVLPLFIVLIGAVMFGVVLGGLSTWIRQGRFRQAARKAEAKANELRAENDQLRSQIAALNAPVTTAIAPRNAA